MNTLADQWALWSGLCMPKDAPPIQRIEMRRAFYAGAEAWARIGFKISAPDVSEAAGVAMLEGLHDELRRFAAEIAAGRA